MKKSLLIVFILSFISSCHEPVKGRNGELYRSASQYNDYIVSRQSKVMKNVMDFVSVSETSLDSAEKMLDKYILQITRIIEEIKGMPPYKNDSALRDAAIATFVFYKRIFDNEYKELIQIRRNGGAFTGEGVAQMQDIVERITREEEQYDKAFHNAQREFAEKNNMKLTDNEMQKQIDKLDKKYQ
jgi:hypothetical protein